MDIEMIITLSMIVFFILLFTIIGIIELKKKRLSAKKASSEWIKKILDVLLNGW